MNAPALSFACRRRCGAGFTLDLAFELKHRFTALFGPSGSGKTTILSLIAGLLRPDEGRIALAERPLVDTQRRLHLAPERRAVAIIFQDSLLFPHLSVEDNLRYGQRRRRGAGRRVDFGRLVDVLEIGPLLRRMPAGLSGGERQRVAIGRALLSGPEMLLMDEPLASLDAPLKARVLGYLQQAVAEWDIPTLFVTHDQSEVRRAAEWAIVIDRGRLVAADTPAEALVHPEPLRWSDRLAPMNLLKLDRISHDERRVFGHIGQQRLRLPLNAVDLTAAGGPPRLVQFTPKDVVLGRGETADLSARNQLHGRVCRVIELGCSVYVAVDVGQILWAEITPESASELGISEGRAVVCVIKAHQLRPLGA